MCYVSPFSHMELCNKMLFIVSYVIATRGWGERQEKSYARGEKIPQEETEAKGIKIKCKCNGKLVNRKFIGEIC